MTSILQPAAKVPGGAGASEDDELDEGEWFVEAILAHQLSDPRTHPTEFGGKPVMLYQVRWQGFKELTWEPAESFPDRSVLEGYQRQSGLLRDDDEDDEDDGDVDENMGEDATVRPATTADQKPPASAHGKHELDSSESDIEEEPYEVESILKHHMSDPRTHGPGLGNEPVMLYEVKWKGYQKPTWEPIDSFEERSVVNRYRKKAGLPPVSDDSD